MDKGSVKASEPNKMIRVKEVMEILQVGKSTAYHTMQQLNKELKAKGYITHSGRIPRVVPVGAVWAVKHSLHYDKLIPIRRYKNGGYVMNRRTTYSVKWPGRQGPNGLALNCHMKDGQLRYFDTLRGHMISGEVIEDGEDNFKFRSAGFEAGIWEFKTLTIEDVRRGVVWIEDGDIIAQAIQTTDDLQEWYRKTFGQDAGLNYPDVLNN